MTIKPPALSVRDLTKSFGGTLALDRVSFDVAAGEVRGLLGQNGSGKSTFVKLLAGFHVPDSGTLSLHGQPVRLPLNVGQFRRLGLSFVHQNLGLVPSLSVLENLRVGALTRPGQAFISWAHERRAANGSRLCLQRVHSRAIELRDAWRRVERAWAARNGDAERRCREHEG